MPENFVFLVIFSMISRSSLCPQECTCPKSHSSQTTKCITGQPEETIKSLPEDTKHLEIYSNTSCKDKALVSLSSLPELRSLQLDILDYHMTSCTYLLDQSSFKENQKLESLRIRPFFIFNQGSTALRPLTQLKDLLLPQAEITWKTFQSLIRGSLYNKNELRKLHFSNPDFGEREVRNNLSIAEIFADLVHSDNLTELDLSNNHLFYISLHGLEKFRRLTHLDISHNSFFSCGGPSLYLQSLEFINLLPTLPSLATLDVGYQGMNKERRWNTRNRYPYVTNSILPDMSKRNNSASIDDCFVRVDINIGQIKTMNAQDYITSSVKSSLYTWVTCVSFSAPNSLHYFDLNGNKMFPFYQLHWDSLLLFNLSHLQTINLQNAGVFTFHEHFFSRLESLQTILLGGNSLGQSLLQKNYFINNTKLKYLELAGNKIAMLSGEFFNNLPRLTYLDLSYNMLTDFNYEMDVLLDLLMLNLSNNIISSLSEEFRTKAESYNFTIDLQGNTFSCFCPAFASVKWIQTTNAHLFKKETYSCVHPLHGQMEILKVDLKKLHDHCFPNKEKMIILVAISSSLGTLLIVLVVTLYCKRWYLRYWWYILHHGWKKYRSQNDCSDYEYDVFVAHSTEDADWVTGELFDELEVKRGLRLCLYQRDILPNEILVEAIVDRIDKSRFTLLVLSPNFIASSWCHFEMHIAQAKLSDEGNDMILPVIFKPLGALSINRTLYYILKRKVYLEWPANERGQSLFWERAARALGAKGSTSADETCPDETEWLLIDAESSELTYS